MTNNQFTSLKINVVFLTIQIILMLELYRQGQYSYTRSILVTTCLWGLYIFLEIKYVFSMNTYVRIIILLTLIFDGFFGCFLDLYTTSSVFDKCLHVFGTYAFSLFAYVLVFQLLKHPINSYFKFILVVCLGVSLGAFYEILEFLTDTISHPTPISQPSLLDTDLDLMGDVIGANLAAIHATFKKFIDGNF